MEKLPRWRRRQALVNREYQLRFSTILLVQMTTVILGMGAFAFIESRVTMDLVLRHLTDFPVPSYDMHLNNQAFLFKIILVIGLSALTQILFGIYTSHKLAGPVLKITRLLEQAARGEFSGRAKFRDGDHMEDLAESVNGLLATLESEQLQAKADIAAIEQGLLRIGSGSARTEDVHAVREQIAALAQVELEMPAGTAR